MLGEGVWLAQVRDAAVAGVCAHVPPLARVVVGSTNVGVDGCDNIAGAFFLCRCAVNSSHAAGAVGGSLPLHVPRPLPSVPADAQSGAIVRHIARSAGLDGDTPARKALADVAYEASKDINGKKAGVYPAAPEADKAALAGFLGGAEHLLARGGGPFTGGAGAGLTFGDLGLFHALKTIDEIQPGFLARAGFPLLARFTDTVAALPHVAAYLASDRRLPLTANETDAAPWRPDGYAWLTPLPASLLAHEA